MHACDHSPYVCTLSNEAASSQEATDRFPGQEDDRLWQ